MSHEQGLRRRAERAAARRARDALGLRRRRRTRDGIDETLPDRRDDAQPLRRLEGGRRRARPGVRPLLRHADGLLPRRLPDRPAALRRRAARLPRLPRAARSARAATYRIFGYKGKQVRDNIHSYDVCTAMLGVLREPAAGRGLQPRRRPREQRLDARGDRALRGAARHAASTRSTSTRPGAATTSATSATSAASAPTIPTGTSRSRSRRPWSRSRACRSRPEADLRERLRHDHRPVEAL